MTKTSWVVLFLLCCFCTLVRSDIAIAGPNTTLSDVSQVPKDHQENPNSETATPHQATVSHLETSSDHQSTKSHSETSKTTESHSIVPQSPTSLSKKVPQLQTPIDLSKLPSLKLASQTVTPSSIFASSSTLPSIGYEYDEDDEDDEEVIRTESIQEARLARKKQRATGVVPEESRAPKPVEKHASSPNDSPVMQGPEDLPVASSSPSSAPEPSTGLGTMGTALLTVGGVLMVAGITGGIFVWRAAQQHRPPPPPSSSGKTELPINLLDLESSPKDPPPSEIVAHRSSGLDFNYSMEKLFNNTSRPVSQPSAPPVISNPAYVAPSIAEEKVQIDDQDLYAASPISIYFPSATP